MKTMHLLFLSLTFLASPVCVEASDRWSPLSDLLKEDIHISCSLRQASGHCIPELPEDILNLISTQLFHTSYARVSITNGTLKKWLSPQDLTALDDEAGDYADWNFTDPASAMAFLRRHNDFSEKAILAFLKRREGLTKDLLQKVSERWQKHLEELVSKKRQLGGTTWKPARAYAAAVLAYTLIELAVAKNAAAVAAKVVATKLAWETSKYEAREAAFETAKMAVYGIAYDAPWELAGKALGGAAEKGAWRASWRAAKKSAYSAAYAANYDNTQSWLEEKLRFLNLEAASQLGVHSYQLAELFSLLWLYENGHLYLQQAFTTAYAELPASITLQRAKTIISEALEKASLLENLENIYIVTIRRDFAACEALVTE